MLILRYWAAVLLLISPIALNATELNADRLDDPTITALVVQKLTSDPILKQYAFQVSTLNGRVSLAADLTTEEQYANAVTLAGSVKDVVAVDGSQINITFLRGESEDVTLTARIKANLMQAGIFSGAHIAWPIRIESEDGNVYVTGRVSTNEDKARVLQIIQSTDGVLSVDEDIDVGFD
jgi:hyperosmotically inducible periplasmic protein